MHPLKFGFIFLLTTAVGLAQTPQTSETIEVTATRIAEDGIERSGVVGTS